MDRQRNVSEMKAAIRQALLRYGTLDRVALKTKTCAFDEEDVFQRALDALVFFESTVRLVKSRFWPLKTSFDYALEREYDGGCYGG